MEAQLLKTENSLELKRLLRVPVSLVYRAWTDPEMMNGWFHPQDNTRSICSVDLRLGGRYEIQMLPEEGGPYIVAGVYREIIPEKKLVFTWQWQGDETNEETLVTVTFLPLGNSKTELTLLHERFGSEEERDSHTEGWQGTFDQLAAALE